MKSKKVWKLVFMLIIVVGIVFAIGTKTVSSYALIDGTNEVHISSSRIENATLIIGTHLIYMGSMNDQIYAMAVKSAQESNQHKRYYKSEIGGGTWYDITEADSLADISTEGIPVSNKEVEALYMTHHTKSDGLTYYLKKNTSVCIFDINNPYNLEEMTELEPIKQQYDKLVKIENPSETIKRDILYIKEIYKFDRKTEETDEIDEKLAALQTYYKQLLKDDAPLAMCDIVLLAMEKLDAARRVKVLDTLEQTQLEKMSQVISREFVYVEGEITGVKDSVTKYKNKKANEASEEAKKQTDTEVTEKIKQLEEELSELIEERDEKISDKKNDITEDWDRIIDLETDAVKIAEYKTSRDKEIKTATTKITNEYASRISKKESEISSEKNGKDSKVQQAGTNASTAVLKGERETLENFVPNTELLVAISDAIANVQESYLTYSAKMYTEGYTVLSQTEYRLVNELVEKAKIESYISCDRVAMKLMYLDRINQGIIREESLEREFINEELMKEAQKSYRTALSAGTGQEYKLLTSAASAGTKENALKSQLNEIEMKRNELQFILQAYVDRLMQEDAVAFLEEKLSEVESFQTEIKSDAFKNYAEFSVEGYEKWLTNALKKAQNWGSNSILEELILQKNKLQTQLLTVLDENLLDKAEKIETEIEAIDKEIAEIENAMYLEESRITASVSENSMTGNTKTQSGTVTAKVQELKEQAVKKIVNGQLEDVENTLEGIGALMSLQPKGVMEALKEIYQELAKQELLGKDSEQLELLVNKVEEITAENMKNVSGQYSEDDLAVLISAFLTGQAVETEFESIMEELDEEELSVVLAGLGIYQEKYPSEDITECLNTYGKIAFNRENDYIFEQLNDALYKAAPTDKLAQISGFRYIFSNSEKTVTLQRRNQYYTFEAFSQMVRIGNDTIQMSQPSGFQGVIYLPEDAVKEHFGLAIQYLPETSYGVILTEKMSQQASEFAEFLEEAGGEF